MANRSRFSAIAEITEATSKRVQFREGARPREAAAFVVLKGIGTLLRRVCSQRLEGSRFGMCPATPRVASQRECGRAVRKQAAPANYPARCNSFQTAHFFSATTFEAIANEIPTAIFIAIGMTFVLIIGGVDLSVGSVLALGAGLLGIAIVQWHWPLWAAVALCVLSGALCGLLNGFLTIRFRLPSFIVTLGLMEAARGATLSGHKFPDHVYRFHHRSGR